MSYDLYITPKQFDARAMGDWFRRRRHYQVGELRAFYANEDTGGYFLFEFEAEPPRDEADEQRRPYVTFNLNFIRPHTFALEAEGEVAAFLTEFESAIDDGQINGMGNGPYSREGFLRGWNAGNRFGFMAAGKQSNRPPPWPADPALVEAIWTWNYTRADLQEVAGDQIFVPRITWFLAAGSDAPVPACIWTEGVPTMIPQSVITHVLLVREPRRGMMTALDRTRSNDNSNIELTLTDVKGLAEVLGVNRRDVRGHTVLWTPEARTIDVQELFSDAWQPTAVTAVPAEEICGADLVALMRGQS